MWRRRHLGLRKAATKKSKGEAFRSFELTNSSSEGAVQWLRKEWANVHQLKEDGVPIVGFTWYSLQDQVDWDTGLRENNGRVNSLGLCDLDRNIRPVGHAYKYFIGKWQSALENEGALLSISR